MKDKKAWEWLNQSDLGYDIWERKYRYNNESFDEWLDRISDSNETVKNLIESKKFLFAGRILSNRGLNKLSKKVTYSNCYVLKQPEDNIESIFDCAKDLARTFSYGGGCGVDISKLSPKGAKVNNAAKETSGAISFMDLYSMTTELIGQNGRRGALMISLDCHHPDIENFITIKSDLDKVTKANISIRVTDDFLQAVEKNENFKLEFTRKETGEKIEKIVKANEIFDKFAEMNWDYAEPAFLFWDRIKNYNLLGNDETFEYAGVNPCAEEPLPAGGSCLLGAINLAEFVLNPFTNSAQFDFSSFEKVVKDSVFALNEVLDEGLSLHPLKIQRETVRNWRQIGLGIMGLADMLIKMGITYGSEESLKLCDEIGNTMAIYAISASSKLSIDNGSYPKFNKEKVKESEFYKAHAKDFELTGLRNSQLLTIAPTGTISTMLGVSGGIEPIFANYYTRKTESLHGEDVYYKIFTPIAWEYLQSHNYGEDETKLPKYFVVSQDIPYRKRIDMQSIWQNHIDASISSTVNLPNSATVDDVKDLYLYAWKKGLKGITVYRDGCKRSGILITNDDNKENDTIKKDEKNIDDINKLPRGFVATTSDDLVGYKRKLQTGCGSIHMEVYADELNGDIQETFINIGSSGGCERNYQFISRLISTALRGGIPIECIIDQAKSIRPCTSYVCRTKLKGDTSPGSSCPYAIGLALQDLYEKSKNNFNFDSDEEEQELPAEKETFEIKKETTNVRCPDCGEPLVFEGSCNVCKNCGWSGCDQ